MKFLVAALGKRLDSIVAKRFEHAAWYLLVDSETKSVEAIRHITPQDRHKALQMAAGQHVEIVVAGRCGDTSLKQMRNHAMRLALVHGVDAARALERIQTHNIVLADADVAADERVFAVEAVQRGLAKAKRAKTSYGTTGFASDTARGHHHLQQYGGRGH